MSFSAIWGEGGPPSPRAHTGVPPRAAGSPPAPCARGTHVGHGQPHGLDGLHVVDLAALTELGRQHTLRESERLSSAGPCAPTPEGTRPTLLDTSQYTRGTTM